MHVENRNLYPFKYVARNKVAVAETEDDVGVRIAHQCWAKHSASLEQGGFVEGRSKPLSVRAQGQHVHQQIVSRHRGSHQNQGVIARLPHERIDG